VAEKCELRLCPDQKFKNSPDILIAYGIPIFVAYNKKFKIDDLSYYKIAILHIDMKYFKHPKTLQRIINRK
jgi:hypothetical protein